MTKDAKRKVGIVMIMSVVIFIGHWIDTFIIIIPGTMALQHVNGQPLIGEVGWMEVATTIGFLGLFMYMVQHSLTKAPLVIKNHPMMEESLHHVV